MKLPFALGNRAESSSSQRGLEPLWSGDSVTSDQDVQGLSELYSPGKAEDTHVYDIVDVCLEMGKISEEQHSDLRGRQKANPLRDGADLLLETDWVSAADILAARAKLYEMEFRHICPEDVDPQAFGKLEVDYIRDSFLCPIGEEDGVLIVATSEPANIFAIEDVKRQTQMDVRAVVCSREDIEAVCDALAPSDKMDYNLDDIISDMSDVEIVQDEEEESEDLERMAGQSPVIKFVNYVISNAIREGASDIHIEPRGKSMKTRYRIDGVLFEMMQSPMKMHPAIVSRIKIMSNLDISERRLPQDGKISVMVGGRAIDLRVSTLPTSHGEKVVIRVLDSKSILRGLEQLGMEPEVMETFAEQVKLPHGIMLVTGPTGSGKSTTLYSALSQMDGEKLNISTVEDPVEYELDFCNQVQAKEKIGLTFAAALRSLLRQDPDVIMVGEIRDNETARVAVQAALTGHLVLSTLHTNDAASSVTRLVNIGIDAYLIAASLNGVLAQRLVRKICQDCKEPYDAPQQMRKFVEIAGATSEQLFHGTGCDQCRGSGYLGRVGIYEFLVVDDVFRGMINKDSSVINMRKAFHKSGCNSLFDDGMMKVKQGLTTIEEVLRVTEVYGKNENEEFVENV
jgi:type IV pilus assembly protein PilB